jgi:hypothetical protein
LRERKGDVQEKTQKEIKRESNHNSTRAHINMKEGTIGRNEKRDTEEGRKEMRTNFLM